MRVSLAFALVVFGACSSNTQPPAPPVPQPPSKDAPPEMWPIPAGWKSETIPFPLGFAPGLAHRGVEELRFPPGMFDRTAPDYWSYAFVWRTDDAAMLAAPILAAELTAYFRGLIAAVDEKKQQVKSIDDIWVKVTGEGEGEKRFSLAINLYDAFSDGGLVALDGWAQRTPCGEGSLWVFVMTPEGSQIRAQLEELAASAACGQKLPLEKTTKSK
jgi:hypothetical protein